MNITYIKRSMYTALGCLVFLLVAASAHASTCAPLGQTADCNLVITINSNLSISTSFPSSAPYDGVEDQLVGIVNNSNSTITSLTLSGNDIFGFDGDGAFSPFCIASGSNTYGCGTGGDSTGYGGPGVTFSITDVNDGVVNFTNGLKPGETLEFSLEEQAAPGQLTTITVGNAPEPGTFLLLGTGLLGLGLLVRRSL